ncbi:proteasome assembly chaperone family protein [Candidatus Parvarchaeota archaeon]|uniref:Proteasome assembly chaperone family protein n=1 Tax=Candidatus Acidifodinimicrobium mancum TaxID=2898728 RepID=A0A8T3UTT9_9ARCH|nr:proteasome assembly chaperone family protein [Candidatus Acidifodinimicrobium mancum]
MESKIVLNSQITPGHYIVTAFPTAGLVSLLAVNYLIQKKILKKIGHIQVSGLTQIAIIEDKHLDYPVRLFEGGDSIFITSQVPVPVTIIEELTKDVFELYGKVKARGIIAIDAIEASEEKDKGETYFIAEGFNKEIKDAKELEDGAMIGINASIALAAKENKTPFLGLMAETHMSIPDGLAASSLINALESIIGLRVDTADLVNEYKRVVSKLNSLINKTNQTNSSKEETYG